MSSMPVRNVLVLVVVALVSGIAGALANEKLQPEDWLLKAPNDTERFRLIQQQFRGFDQPMWEIGERWSRIHDALTRGNYELALFHWWKIEQTIGHAIVRRPQRAANARAFFLDRNYQRIRAEFESRDPKRAWSAFTEARGICRGCHVAEKSGFANDTAVFDLAPPKAYAAANNKEQQIREGRDP